MLNMKPMSETASTFGRLAHQHQRKVSRRETSHDWRSGHGPANHVLKQEMPVPAKRGSAAPGRQPMRYIYIYNIYIIYRSLPLSPPALEALQLPTISHKSDRPPWLGNVEDRALPPAEAVSDTRHPVNPPSHRTVKHSPPPCVCPNR